jgi:hypothetical protein
MILVVNNHNPVGELIGDDEFWGYISWDERIRPKGYKGRGDL